MWNWKAAVGWLVRVGRVEAGFLDGSVNQGDGLDRVCRYEENGHVRATSVRSVGIGTITIVCLHFLRYRLGWLPLGRG